VKVRGDNIIMVSALSSSPGLYAPVMQGGNPLDFKLGHVASLSVQSTSVTDQIAEQNVIR
jgi:hypothetical protein